MNAYRKCLLAGVVTLATLPLLASANPHGHRGGGHRPHSAPAARVWHGDIRHFHRHDHNVWRGGAWRHTHHGGRNGWWWVVGGMWYFYPQPVYPYPDPYAPATVVIQQPVAPVVMPQTTAPAPAPVAAPANQVWYYCEPSATYYPYVASCTDPWKLVPATPAAGDPQ